MGATNPRMWSGRLVALGYAAAMTIIMSIYTARITADGIEGIVKDDFKGFDDERVSINISYNFFASEDGFISPFQKLVLYSRRPPRVEDSMSIC